MRGEGRIGLRAARSKIFPAEIQAGCERFVEVEEARAGGVAV